MPDLELLLLREGQRQLVKRERVPLSRVDAVLAELRTEFEAARVPGFAYGRGRGDDIALDETGFTTVLAARSSRVLERAIELVRAQHDVSSPRAAQIEAVVEQGRLLGYPECCVQAHVRGPNGPWFTRGAAGYVLDGVYRTTGAPHALLNPFVSPRFITHSLCGYDCAPSIELAEHLARAAPALVAAHQRPVLAWDAETFVTFDALDRYTSVDGTSEAALALLRRGDRLVWRPGSAVVFAGDVAVGRLADVAPMRLPILFAWGVPWPRPPKIALLEMRTTGQHFFGDDLAILGGDLRAMGVDASLWYAEVGRADEERASYAAIARAMRDRGVTRVVVEHALSPALLAAIDLPAIVLHTDEERGVARPIDRARALRRILGDDAHDVPEIRSEASALEVPFVPLVEYEDVPGIARRVPEQFYLRGNAGCPYSKRYSDPEAASYLPRERGLVRLRGCNFCSSGGDYRRLGSHDAMAASLASQISWIARHAPTVRRFVIGDTYPMPYLVKLVDRVRERGVELLVQARPDWFLRIHPEIEALLPSLEARELQLVFYLIGFENFSQAELDRLDKGLTVEENERTIEALRDLEARFPRAFSARKYASHGFLLFHPWTTLEDLAANAEVIERTRFHEYRGAFLLSRLRLYPYHPFFHKARAHGLLIDAYDRPERSSARRIGYAAEHPWRAADPRVDEVFDVVATLHDEIDPAAHARLLARAVELVRGSEEGVVERLRGELPRAHPLSPIGPRALERFGPLALGAVLAPGCTVTALHFEEKRVRVETTVATFAIDPERSGPFDAGALGIWYYAAPNQRFTDLEPAGRRLRELFLRAGRSFEELSRDTG